MMDKPRSSYQNAIKNAFKAIRAGNRKEAIRWTNLAVAQKPKEEDPWLLMAYLASPDQSVEYLNHALKLNPQSQRARKGLEWANKRAGFKPQQEFPEPELLEITQKMAARVEEQQPKPKPKLKAKLKNTFKMTPLEQRIIGGFFAFTSVIFIAIMVWLISPDIVKGGDKVISSETEPALVLQASQTPTSSPTPTNTPTLIPTNTSTSTPTDIPTNTPTPTFTPTNTSIPVINPTRTPLPIPPFNADHNWIGVDLSDQTVTAYTGNNPIRSFTVSTGTWMTPTVKGVYFIFSKYRYNDMAGPGYYLPDVPYVLYFYEGYSIHGTYWHDNFGTPMSHGCVNMTIDDAGWIYNFAELGTIVYVKD